MFTCTKCGKEKANAKFAPDANMKSGKSSWCKECKSEYTKAYNKARRSLPGFQKKRDEQNRASRLGWYGITIEDYDEMLKIQNGRCAGCGRLPKTTRRLDVDHKHQSGDKKRAPWERASMIRGLLCHLCNRAIGILKDNPETFKNLAKYLESPPAVPVILPRFEAIIEYLEAYEARKGKQS